MIPNHILLQIAEILPREQQGILACFSYQPVIVKQNLHLIHKLIKRARETPLQENDDPAELPIKNMLVINSLLKALTRNSSFIQENDEDELHDIKDESTESGIEEDILPIKVKTSSAMSAVFNFSNDPPPSKKAISKEVNDTFADPLNEQSIPYQLYLRPQKVETIDAEETPEKIWKVRPAAPLKEEKEEVESSNSSLPEREKEERKEERISINEMKGKRKSDGAIPDAKKQRVAPVQAYNFGKKDFKIFGQHKVVEQMNQRNQKGKKGKKSDRKSAPGAPGYFTEPNFGKINQKSKAMKNAVKSFTVKR